MTQTRPDSRRWLAPLAFSVLACPWLGPTTPVHAQAQPPAEAPPAEAPPAQAPPAEAPPAEAPPAEAPPAEGPPAEGPPAEAPPAEAPPAEAPPAQAPPAEAPPADVPAGAPSAEAPPAEPTPETPAEAPTDTQPSPTQQGAAPEAAQATEAKGPTDPFESEADDAPGDASADEEDDWGQEEEGWGDEGDSAGFGDAGAAAPEAATGTESIPGELSVGGFLRHMAALWTERLEEQPLSRARQSADFSLHYKKPFATSDGRITLRAVADVHFEYDFAYQADRDLYDEATLDTYEHQVVGGETFLALSIGNLDVAFGRQIVAWGHGEMLSPVDIVNPRDQRDPAIAELDDVRMAVLASRVGLFFDAHRLELMVIHESYFGLRAAPLSDLSPLRGIILDDPSVGMLLEGQELRYHDNPDRFDSQASQVLGRWTYTGPGIDLALYAASTLDKQGVATPTFGADGIVLDLWHPRYTMLGHAGAYPSGDFIYRWELGVDLQRPISSTGGGDVVSDAAPGSMSDGGGFFTPPVFRDRLNWMLGTSYGGITDGTLSIEYGQSFIFDNPERDGSGRELLFSPEQPAFAARYTHMFLRERLQATAVGMMFGLTSFRGMMGKVDLSYVVADGWKIGAGYTTFVPAEDEFGPFYGFDTHDRVYGTLRWDFLLE